jgi:hypothetical protein
MRLLRLEPLEPALKRGSAYQKRTFRKDCASRAWLGGTPQKLLKAREKLPGSEYPASNATSLTGLAPWSNASAANSWRKAFNHSCRPQPAFSCMKRCNWRGETWQFAANSLAEYLAAAACAGQSEIRLNRLFIIVNTEERASIFQQSKLQVSIGCDNCVTVDAGARIAVSENVMFSADGRSIAILSSALK